MNKALTTVENNFQLSIIKERNLRQFLLEESVLNKNSPNLTMFSKIKDVKNLVQGLYDYHSELKDLANPEYLTMLKNTIFILQHLENSDNLLSFIKNE